MKRWLPHPWMAGCLFLTWLALWQSLAPGIAVLGLMLALLLSRVYGWLEPPPVRVRHMGRLLMLVARVFGDIVRSNLAVTRIIVGRPRALTSGFVAIPLEMTNRYALAMLACIITATPGTVWVRHDAARQTLVIHVLDLVDDAAWIARIKQRYERPLLKIFQ